MRNKIEEIFQDVFVRDVSRLIYAAVNEHCDGCKMDDLSQLHHGGTSKRRGQNILNT